jgi:ribonuclease-3
VTGAALERLSVRLGYEFRDPGLLARALTHRSAQAASNERLEFLGDGLLNFVVGLMLYQRHPEAAEGDLTYQRASCVREEALVAVAERLELGEALILGAGDRRSGVAGRASVLADTLEAVLGAVFLDGGLDAARAVCERLFGEKVAQPLDPEQAKDAKTRLQEHLQHRGRPLPVYTVAAAEGPPHRQAFTIVCRLADGADQTEGQGGSRKAAEQEAARKMLALLTGTETEHA